jgi:hypothetical protein
MLFCVAKPANVPAPEVGPSRVPRRQATAQDAEAEDGLPMPLPAADAAVPTFRVQGNYPCIYPLPNNLRVKSYSSTYKYPNAHPT